MEMLIDVQDQKAHLLLSTSTHLSGKKRVLQEIEEAVENIKLVQAGKLQATSIEELLDRPLKRLSEEYR